jgi:hypothetical protein
MLRSETTGRPPAHTCTSNSCFVLAEGVPYEFDSFVLVGHVKQKTGRQLLPTPQPHTKQLPLTLNIVNFRDRS